ncbi:MAG: BACON domain-containing protein, partial [Thermoanaerobaculia bacterium]
MRGTWNRCVGAVAACLIAAAVFAVPAAFAVVPPDGSEPLRQKELFHPDLHYINVFVPIAGLEVDLSRRLGSDLGSLGVDPGNAYFDRRTGRWGTLILTRPLVPGTGVGNDLQWSDLGRQQPRGAEALERAAWQAFRTWLIDNAAALRIDPEQLGEPSVTAIGERLIHINVGRAVDGIPVRHTFVTAAINSGNLVLTGQRNWGEVSLDTTPRVAADGAEEILRGYLDGLAAAGLREPARLEIVPVSDQDDESRLVIGQGVNHRLVWVLQPILDDHRGSWEALVDAHSGEVLSFQDMNDYLSRRVEGGIYPVSNDGMGDEGTEQPDYPMPFADILLDGNPVGFTTTGGNLPLGTDAGTISTTLSGQFVRMADVCGAVNESAAAGDLDLLEGPGTNCEVPPGHSAGDTHASRTGFYELNRLKEQALGYLPTEPWLNEQLTANMNINLVCNAFWSNTNFTVNFYREGASPTPPFECRNTGEIAAVFDHEWGHGMDRRTGVMAISRPGEGIADVYAQNRLNTSCIGRGFWLANTSPTSPNCAGYGDPCLECDGVREVDYAKRQSGLPHTVAWIDANCPAGTGTPCGGATHCEGSVVSETSWDLVHRDLMGFEGSDFNLDLNTALELGTRLAFNGSFNVVDWYQCVSDGTGGCNADSGYLGWLTVDDDDGDLTNGTPHMSALFAAFDRHQIACNAPVVQNSGCAGAPTDAPTNLATTAFDEGMELTWDAVPDAVEYQIFRTEGVNGCDFGKALVGTTTGTSFTETGLRNGFEVLYSVMAVGTTDACTGPMSACHAVIPVAGPSGTLTGTVTNSVTTAPIQGVAIQAVGPVTLGGMTLADGTYTISAPVGTYDITASMDGFFPQTVNGVVVTEGGTATNNFALVPLPQTIEVTPASFTFEVFEAQSDSDTLNVGNIGNVDLTWNIGETTTDCATQADVGWLAADPASGVTPPFSSLEVTVSVDSTGLTPGVHEASFCVNSDDPETPVVEVPVTLTVVAAPAIQVAPEEIVVSVEAGDTEVQTLTVSNLGSIDLDWTIVQEALRRGLNAPLGGYRPVTDGAPRSGLVLAPADGAADTALDPELVAAAEAGIELSEPLPPDRRPRARGTSPNDVLQDGALIVPNTTLNFIVALDPETGDVVDPALIDISAFSGARREALLHPDGERVLLTAQTGDVVHAFSVEDGSYLGVFAPAGGADTSILNNVRGMAFHPVTGNLLVTSADDPAADRIVEFDLEGNFVGVFIDGAANGLTSPWDLLVRESDILVTNFLSPAGVQRYDFDGNFLDIFADLTGAPAQMAFAANGNILVSSLSDGLYELDPDGNLVANYKGTVTSQAGVYELPNLNFLVTGSVGGQGIQELDRNNQHVGTKMDGTSYFINFAKSLDCTIPSWLTVMPTSGTTTPGGSTDVTVTIDTELLGLGEHEASICFESNDP